MTSSIPLDRLRLKLLAFLHDPPEMASLLMQPGPRHNETATRYFERLLGSDVVPTSTEASAVNKAEQIAAGANEYNFPRNADRSAVVFLEDPVVRHPLSGSEIRLDLKAGFDLEVMREQVNGSLDAMLEAYGSGGDQAERLTRIYLSLWREWPALLRRQEGETDASLSGNRWNLFPSDTRIPDHTIWEHLSLTSALAGAGIETDGQSTASLLLFTLGPVQDFIAAARKTSDLWGGSYLLAYLTWQGIRVVCERCGPDALLFPDLYGQPLVDHWLRKEGLKYISEPKSLSAATIPNRFFAVVPDREADVLAREAETAIREAFVEAGRFALKKLDQETTPHEEQLRRFIECNWAVLPFHRFSAASARTVTLQKAFEQTYPSDLLVWDDPRASAVVEAFDRHQHNTNAGAFYGRLYKAVEALVGSRKALRDFARAGASRSEPGYRCSLIPALPALVPGVEASPGEVRAFWQEATSRVKKGKLRRSERLSAVALAKRFFPEYLEKNGLSVDARFPSTSSIASADYKADVIAHVATGDEGGLKPAIKHFRGLMESFQKKIVLEEAELPRLEAHAREANLSSFSKLSGDWFYLEAFDVERLNAEYGSEDNKEPFAEGEFDRVKEALEALLRATDKAGIDRPSKYYAVLLLDGDRMGKWLSGENAPLFRDALHPNVLKNLEAQIEQGDHAGWKPLLQSGRTQSPDEDGMRRPTSPAMHLAISRALGTFALRHVRRIVEDNHLGRVVYSGGDDVLAFVSFRDALDVARKLRAAFSGHLHGDGYIDWTREDQRAGASGGLTMGHTATASAGLTFAHHTQPLAQVLAQARRTEKYAKEEVGRDALALCMMKRSGETFTTGLRWTTPPPDRAKSLTEALDCYAELIRTGQVSTGFVYNLENEKDSLNGLGEGGAAAVRGEALRLFLRQAEAIKDVESRKEAFDQTVGLLLEHAGLERTVSLLDAAQFLGLGGAR